MNTFKKIAISAIAMAFSFSVLADTPAEEYEKGAAAMKAGDVRVGRAYLKRAADAGHLQAQYDLGVDFLRLGGLAQAGEYLQKAADAGYAPAQAEFGMLLMATDEDFLAAKYFEMASKQQNPEGDYRLGSLYVTGQTGKKDLKKALELLKRAAENGHSQAIEDLGMAYVHGTMGLTENELNSPEAFKWIQKAAEQDYLPALERLRDVYQKGLLGQPVDLAKAQEAETRIKQLKGDTGNDNKKTRRSAPKKK